MPTIGGTALLNARRVPDREAVVEGSQSWTWRELSRLIGVAAAALDDLGLRRGHRMALLAANSVEFIVASHAASRVGGIVVPINTRLAVPEIVHIVSDSGATALAFGVELASVAEAVRVQVPAVLLAALGDGGDHPHLIGDDLTTSIDDDLAAEDDDAFILYTSGTTGRPKGSLMDHHRAVWAAMAQIVSLGLRDGDRHLHLAPMYHSGGTTFLNATTMIGGTHVVAGRFEASAVLPLVAQHRIDWLFGVPTMYQQMLRCEATTTPAIDSWRIGVYGGAPMPAPVIEQLVARFPSVSFFQQCGQTEAGPTGIYSTLDQIRSRPDSSGHVAQPFMECKVLTETGSECEPGGVGELVFRGPALTKGYWNQPAATAEAVRDGWLHTGDLVHVHDDGAMRLVDRMKDVIITGGRNVYSAEVEQAIASHPDVLDVAVVGKPHPEWGATVTAVVTLAARSTATASDIEEHCRTLIADYKIPRVIELGAVPRNSTGKVQKHVLRNVSTASTGH